MNSILTNMFLKPFRLFTTFGAALCLVVISACETPSGQESAPDGITLQPSQAYVENYVTLSAPGSANSYTWTLRAQPDGSQASLTQSGASVDFTPDVAGNYTVAVEGGNLDAPLERKFRARSLPSNTERAARDIINGINETRQAGATCNGTPFEPTAKLSEDDRLESAALKHSRDMMIYGYFAHESRSDGSKVGKRVRDANYDWQAVGENIARGASLANNPARVVSGWVNSPTNHCEMLMNPNFTEIGVAVVDYEGSPYWTAVFAKPK